MSGFVRQKIEFYCETTKFLQVCKKASCVPRESRNLSKHKIFVQTGKPRMVI